MDDNCGKLRTSNVRRTRARASPVTSIPCLHNVVLCLLCVPLATSVYFILSFMLYFCHSFAHIVYIALLCLLCVLTPVLPGHININQSINERGTE